MQQFTHRVIHRIISDRIGPTTQTQQCVI